MRYTKQETQPAANRVPKAIATNWALPPIANINTNPSAHTQAVAYVIGIPYVVASHLKILIPVGTAMFIVADVKYACLSTSIPTVNMWCAHTTNSNNPFAIMANIIP